MKKEKKILHYVAVNGRTKELMGSIPINKPLLFVISTIIETIAVLLSLYIMMKFDFDRYTIMLSFFICTAGFVFYKTMFDRYRNGNARHTYEKETKTTLTFLSKEDTYIKQLMQLDNEKIKGQNNTRIDGENVGIVDKKN